MSLTDAFNAPLIVKVNGKDYRLAYLTMDDLANVSREIVHEAKTRELNKVSISKKQERDEVSAYYDALDLDMNELGRQCMTLKGSVRFVHKALTSAGHSDAEAQQFIDGITASEGYLQLGNLACRVSRLFKPVTRPNGQAASGNTDAANKTPPTGEASQESSAEPSAAEIPAS